MLKYTGAGCYRFIDSLGNVIYIGSSKSIHRRLSSHFNGKQGHLGSTVYNQVARVEICKLEDYPTTLAMEIFLINKYKSRYNKKDKSHNMNSTVTKNSEFYEKLENWQTYYKFKELDSDKIEINKKQDFALTLIMYFVFISAIIGYFIK